MCFVMAVAAMAAVAMCSVASASEADFPPVCVGSSVVIDISALEMDELVGGDGQDLIPMLTDRPVVSVTSTCACDPCECENCDCDVVQFTSAPADDPLPDVVVSETMVMDCSSGTCRLVSRSSIPGAAMVQSMITSQPVRSVLQRERSGRLREFITTNRNGEPRLPFRILRRARCFGRGC